MSILLPLVIALFVFAYHYERNGNPLSFGEFFSRAFWAGSFSLGYVALAGASTNIFLAALYGALTFAAILVPSSFAEQMGREAAPWSLSPLSKRWPAFWMPSYTQAQWSTFTGAKKTRIDFYGILSAGVLRGSVVFLPSIALGAPVFQSVIAAAAVALWQPFAYLAGRFTPFRMWDNSPYSTEWGEFYIGIGWALALWFAVV
jgi:hypothetical protein